METNIREYCEEYPVEIKQLKESDEKDLLDKDSLYYEACMDGRYVIVAVNEGGYNSTEVDLVDLLHYVKNNLPELLELVK